MQAPESSRRRKRRPKPCFLLGEVSARERRDTRRRQVRADHVVPQMCEPDRCKRTDAADADDRELVIRFFTDSHRHAPFRRRYLRKQPRACQSVAPAL